MTNDTLLALIKRLSTGEFDKPALMDAVVALKELHVLKTQIVPALEARIAEQLEQRNKWRNRCLLTMLEEINTPGNEWMMVALRPHLEELAAKFLEVQNKEKKV
jgi:hypothetical protein